MDDKKHTCRVARERGERGGGVVAWFFDVVQGKRDKGGGASLCAHLGERKTGVSNVVAMLQLLLIKFLLLTLPKWQKLKVEGERDEEGEKER